MRDATLICVLFAFSSVCFAQEGVVIFSVEITDVAELIRKDGSPVIHDKTGIFYYYKQAKAGEYGPTVTGYKFENGKIGGVAGGGSIGSEIFLQKLMNIPISGFDVAAEIEATLEKLRLEAQRNGTSYSLPSIRDGAEYKISFAFNGIDISYKAWNPGPLIDELAKHNSSIKNFKDVIDLFATDYGRNTFGL